MKGTYQRTERWKPNPKTIILGMATLAIVINSLFIGTRANAARPQRGDNREPTRSEAAPEGNAAPTNPGEESLRRKEEKESLEREGQARLLSKYLKNPSLAPSSPVIAVAVAGSGSRLDDDLAFTLKEKFTTTSVDVDSSFFHPELVSDGLHETLWKGSNETVRKLHLNQVLQGLLLAKESVKYSQNPGLENVTTATVTFEIRFTPFSESYRARSWSLNAAGAGFDESAALELGRERVLKKLQSLDGLNFQGITR